MRGDAMRWIGRLVAVVFGLGVLNLIGAVVVLVQRAEGVPPLPVFAGVIGLVALILLAGACLALISVAVSARQGVEALRQLAGQPSVATPGPVADPVPAGVADDPIGPLTPTGLGQGNADPARPVRPTGRVLVAER